MGHQQSREELLFQQVSYGNVERITALCREGAGLEWTDKGGKTPLMVACMSHKLYDAAKTLIELGADVNRYRRGCEGGTPLHHAAKQGLERTVQLLLSHGANALLVNDDGQSALDVARIKGHVNVVRAIESHLCLFSGWLRELSGPVFLELLAPRLVSRNVWVVVVPCGSRTLSKPFKLELAIYHTLQDARPCIHLALWRANLHDSKINQPDPAVIISDASTKMRIKLAPTNEKDKQQLQRFCYACKGIPQVFHQNFPFNMGLPIVSPHPETTSSGTITQFAPTDAGPNASSSCCDKMKTASSTQFAESKLEVGSSSNQMQGGDHSSSNLDEHFQDQDDSFVIVDSTSIPEDSIPSSSSVPSAPTAEDSAPAPPSSVPSAPPADNLEGQDGPINYPSVDFSPLDMSSSINDELLEGPTGREEASGGDSSTCSICLDSPVEGACVPCGHMAGCMRCLNEIVARKWGCPVCRTNVEQIIRIYAV